MVRLQRVFDPSIPERDILARAEPVLARRGLKRQRNDPSVDLHEWACEGVFVLITRESWADFWWVSVVSHDDRAPVLIDELERAELSFESLGDLRTRARSPGRRGAAVVRLAHAVSLDGDGSLVDLLTDLLEHESDGAGDLLEGAVRAAAHLGWPMLEGPLERVVDRGGPLGDLAEHALHTDPDTH